MVVTMRRRWKVEVLMKRLMKCGMIELISAVWSGLLALPELALIIPSKCHQFQGSPPPSSLRALS